jgi:hypothetical protein
MPTQPNPITLSQIARRATEVVDPAGADDDVLHLYTQLEDDDRPITSVQDLEGRLALATDGLEEDAENPLLEMAVATILYLAHRRDELNDDPDDILRLTARAEWDGKPPDFVADWLATRGIDV